MAEAVGYDDTPFLPDSKWRVHDGTRPQPRIVTPATTDAAPPSDAIIQFNGTDLSKWSGREGEAKWKVENGYMEATTTGDIETYNHFGDCQVHLEWAAPAEVIGNSQGRGNSGVFLMGLYEIQVLDGYDNPTYADGLTASIYGEYPPLVNACRKPGEWQTYDIIFEAPSWKNDHLVKAAYITVIHNGVVVHHRKKALGPTGHRNVANYETPHAPTGPLKLQDHGNPVRYRNVWIRPLTDYDEE